jgi:hypothetical protein
VRSNALKESQDVTGFVGDLLVKQRRTQERVDADDFLEESGDGAYGVPDVWSKLREMLSLLAESHESVISLVSVFELINLFDDHLFFLLGDTGVIEEGTQHIWCLHHWLLLLLVQARDSNLHVVHFYYYD